MGRDFIGQELKEGDKVIFLHHYKTSSCLYEDIVKRISDKTVLLECGRRKTFDKLIKINTEMFLLKAAHYDTEYEPIGLFSSMKKMEEGKAEYLKKKAADGLDVDAYKFTFERYTVNELS